MKVAAYLRVATRKQLPDGQQLAMQMSSIKAWADQGSHEIVRIFEDLAASGTDPSRPGLTLMLAEAESPERPFDAVVVATLSRFFRDSIHFVAYERRLGEIGVKLISTSQPRDDELSELTRRVIALIDDYNKRCEPGR